VRKIRFFPNTEQYNILHTWFNECDTVYNYCCDKFNKDPVLFQQDYTKTKIVIFTDLYGDSDKNCPYDILTSEVKRFHSNIKSCYTNLRRKNIKHFTMKHKNTYKSQSICIPNNAINGNTFYKSHLGKCISGLPNLQNIVNDSYMVYNKLSNIYTINIPMYCEKKEVKHKREPIVALDPGEKIFITYHGINTFGAIGIHVRKKILSYQKKIKKYQSVLNKGVNRRNQKLNNTKKKKIKKHIQKNYNRIKNYVKKLHNKTALYLCKNYERILLPEFGTHGMVLNKKRTKNELIENRRREINEAYNKCREEGKRVEKSYNRRSKLSKRVKYVLNALSHYKFKQHLLRKSEEYGCELRIVCEAYTTKTCTNCGLQSQNYKNRIKKCGKCKYKLDRDIVVHETYY
jgi:putative transposase